MLTLAVWGGGGGGSRKRSKAWMHFTVQKDDPDHANCNYCDAVLGCKSASAGTASLVNHLKICQKNHAHICSTQSELTYQVSEDGNLVVPWQYIEKEVREAFARMIVIDLLPFIFAEKEGFRLFMAKACPRFTVPSRTTMYRDIIAIYEAEKAMLRKYFIESRQTVCLTTDTWTSKRQQSYMVLTAHSIDSGWKLRKKIINFVLVDGHKGDDIGKSLEKLLIEWGIERVCTITVDNASSNDTCLAYMKRSLTNARSRYLGMRCVAHIINLVVQDGLKIMCHPRNRIRSAIKFVRASPTRLDLFKKCVQLSKVVSKGLINIDVVTRWNSTFIMLETAEKFERAFEQYALQDPNYKTELEKTGPEPKPDTPDQRGPPTQSDWVYVREFKQFLQHFYLLTNKVSGTKYVTANTFLEDIADVHFMLGEWSDHVICGDGEIFKCMATKMKTKYEKYWGDPEKMNKYIFIAAILDPRYMVNWLLFICQI
uniref:BED-type domain-containing protein n=1 Tax=Aegilops tauschii subsp. strangulata TaxID=200361 RepID=A0A453LLI9_AEGTS